MSRALRLLAVACAVSAVTLAGNSCGDRGSPAVRVPARVTPEIVRMIPHDTLAFTQGLVYDDGALYESTGLYGRSSLRRIDAESGAVQKQVALDDRLFGEGLATSGERLVQLTWRAGRAIVYSRADFSVVDAYDYAGEGWGLTLAPQGYVMSDGSSTLYYHDRNFARLRAVAVTLEGKPLSRLNELEYARGLIYANVWYSNYIFEIEPNHGVVERIVDCTELVEKVGGLDEDAVLNGIAYDRSADRFFLTGKNWPLLFEVRIPRS